MTGEALNFALTKDISVMLLNVAKLCKSVICCRVTPIQKVDNLFLFPPSSITSFSMPPMCLLCLHDILICTSHVGASGEVGADEHQSDDAEHW